MVTTAYPHMYQILPLSNPYLFKSKTILGIFFKIVYILNCVLSDCSFLKVKTYALIEEINIRCQN